MSNTQANTLVLKDEAGTYYLLSQETLEQGRVPEGRTADLEQFLTAATHSGAGESDAEGYAIHGVVLGAFLVYSVGLVIGVGLHNYLMAEDQIVPDIDYSAVGSSEPLPLPGGGRGHF